MAPDWNRANIDAPQNLPCLVSRQLHLCCLHAYDDDVDRIGLLVLSADNKQTSPAQWRGPDEALKTVGLKSWRFSNSFYVFF